MVVLRRLLDGHFKFERRAAALLCSLCLLAWLVACVTDVNHPPGARAIRLLAAAVVIILFLLEHLTPWRGIIALCAIWPQMVLLKTILAAHMSPLWILLPEFWAGPASAALAIAIFLRLERSGPVPNEDERSAETRSWIIRAARLGFWIFICGWLLSLLLALPELLNPPPQWSVDPTDPRHMLTTSPRSAAASIVLTMNILPPMCLGLLLLNLIAPADSKPAKSNDSAAPNEVVATNETFPCRTIALVFTINAVLVAIYVILQAISVWEISGLHGAFANRNTTGPYLALSCPLVFAALLPRTMLKGFVCILIILLLTAAIVLTSSRNAVFILLVWGLVSILASNLRAILKTTIILAACVAVFAIPWKNLASRSSSENLPVRIVSTMQAIKDGNWRNITGGRLGIFRASWEIFNNHPFTGTGPGTLPMVVHSASPHSATILAADGEYFDFYTAHSMPLQLLAETGVLSAFAWGLLWLVIPAPGLFRAGWSKHWAITALLMGFGNLVDTLWMVPGMTGAHVLILIGALQFTGQLSMKRDRPFT